MISKEDYLSALEIVEKYHKQLNQEIKEFDKNKDKTKIEDWGKLKDCSHRLKRSLLVIYDRLGGDFVRIEYIEDITEKIFLRNRNVGKVTWSEFKTLRGY